MSKIEPEAQNDGTDGQLPEGRRDGGLTERMVRWVEGSEGKIGTTAIA